MLVSDVVKSSDGLESLWCIHSDHNFSVETELLLLEFCLLFLSLKISSGPSEKRVPILQLIQILHFHVGDSENFLVVVVHAIVVVRMACQTSFHPLVALLFLASVVLHVHCLIRLLNDGHHTVEDGIDDF